MSGKLRRKRARPKIEVVAHYMEINGELVEIDPAKTDLPDRCKLVIVEAITGQKCRLVDPGEVNGIIRNQ